VGCQPWFVISEAEKWVETFKGNIFVLIAVPKLHQAEEKSIEEPQSREARRKECRN
jgi:hypothetical protein